MNKNENELVNDPFKVYVRIRPLLDKELNFEKDSENSSKDADREKSSANKNGIKVVDNMIYISDVESTDIYTKKEKCFPFDDVFSEKDDNQTIFDKIVKNLVNNIMNGYNATAVAYGVTGSGKTHTMFGDVHINLSVNEKGICIHAVDYLFELIKAETSISFLVKINYIEIYNEQVIDLLVEKRQESNDYLMIIEDPIKGVLVPEVREYKVTSSEEVMNLIQIGNSRRVMAPTGANQFSSRSHAILQIIVDQRRDTGGKEQITSSKLLLVDLAGSERGSLEKGIRREEGANINKSLLALGNCINILSDKHKKGSFVPYRDSKLTRLLKDSLGGNISTIMIACISPSIMSQDETMNTLKYASRARNIQKKITRNVKEVDINFPQYREFVDGLKREITQLKEVINNQNFILKYKQIDSFFEGRDLNNIKLNNIFHVHSEDSLKENNMKNKYPERMKSKRLSSNSHQVEIPVANNINEVNHINFEIYEEFLKKNFNNLSDEELEEFSIKLQSLYFDKITLEEKIMRGAIDNNTNENYSIVKMFYEKYIEKINEKLIENIENNLILKFNLKEILELNQANNLNLNNLNSQIEVPNSKEDESKNFNKDKDDLEKIISDNEKEKEEISLALEKNLKIKRILKDILLKFISNTQIKEIKDLREAYISIENDKRELELKNKKYQEFLSTILKEKDDNEKKFSELKKELQSTKKNLADKDKKLNEAEKKIKDLDHQIKNDLNYSTKQNKLYDHSRVSSSSRKHFSNDSKYNNNSTMKKVASPRNILKNVRKFSLNSSNRGITNNYININVTSKIPRVTAILQNGNLITTSVSNINFSSNSISISKLRKNLNSSSNKTVTDFTKNSNTNSNQHKFKLEDLVGKYEKDSRLKANSRKSSLIKSSLKNSLKPDSKDKRVIRTNSNYKENNLRNIFNSDKNVANYRTVFSNLEKEKLIMNNNNNLDCISLSAVSVSNDACLNSSVLEIMENVLNLDGIKNQKRNPEIKTSMNCKDTLDNNFGSVNYISEFLKRNKIKEEGEKIFKNYDSDKIHSEPLKENKNLDDIFNRALDAVKESGSNKELVKDFI